MLQDMTSGWQKVQHRALNAGASLNPPLLTDGVEFVFLGEPVFVDNQFVVNVFTFEDGLVRVLSGDDALARRCLAARIRWGPLAVFTKTEESLDFVEELREVRLDSLPVYDLEDLYGNNGNDQESAGADQESS